MAAAFSAVLLGGSGGRAPRGPSSQPTPPQLVPEKVLEDSVKVRYSVYDTACTPGLVTTAAPETPSGGSGWRAAPLGEQGVSVPPPPLKALPPGRPPPHLSRPCCLQDRGFPGHGGQGSSRRPLLGAAKALPPLAALGASDLSIPGPPCRARSQTDRQPAAGVRAGASLGEPIRASLRPLLSHPRGPGLGQSHPQGSQPCPEGLGPGSETALRSLALRTSFLPPGQGPLPAQLSPASPHQHGGSLEAAAHTSSDCGALWWPARGLVRRPAGRGKGKPRRAGQKRERGRGQKLDGEGESRIGRERRRGDAGRSGGGATIWLREGAGPEAWYEEAERKRRERKWGGAQTDWPVALHLPAPSPTMCRVLGARSLRLPMSIRPGSARLGEPRLPLSCFSESEHLLLQRPPKGLHKDEANFRGSQQCINVCLLRDEYAQKLADADVVERHIIQARARSVAEEERVLNNVKAQEFGTVQLPPVKSAFRWCVNNELLKKHSLICPEDYIQDPLPFSRAPKEKHGEGTASFGLMCNRALGERKELPAFLLAGRVTPLALSLGYNHGFLWITGESDPEGYKLTFSYKQHRVGAEDIQKVTEMVSKKKLPVIPSEVSLSTLTKCSTPEVTPPKAVKKCRFPKNKMWMNHLNTAQRVQERRLLARFENQHNFLKNPRFFPPNTANGGKSLIFPLKKTGPMRDERNVEFSERNFDDTPVFLAKPAVGFFTDYVVGPVYEIVLELQNMTSTSRHLRVLPPCTQYFSLGLGRFPGEAGLVAPGMICRYTVRFAPDSLGDFDDFILVETQAAHTLLIPLQARRPPPMLTLASGLDCGYCLVGGIKITGFICKNIGLSTGRFCIMPKSSWPPPSFRSVAAVGFVEQAPFGILPAVFELIPGQALLLEVLFLPTSLETVEKSFIIVCDNCQVKEVLISGTGQLVALELLYVSGEASYPEPGELTDLTAQHFIRFESQNIQTTTSKHLIIRNVTHVALPFHWQIMKPNLLPLMPGEIWTSKDIKYYPDPETAFYVTPRKGSLQPHADHEFILSFSPEQLKDYHSVIQIVLEEVPDPICLENENVHELPCAMDDIIALEIEVKGSVEPFQILLEPYAIIIPGENYIGVNVKTHFKMWNNSKSAIQYTWGKISDCHIVEVEPYTGVIEPNEKGEFELNFTGGAPGVTSQELLCKIDRSPVPVVLHIEAAFKGPTLNIDVSALHFGLVRLGKKAIGFINIQNTSQLPAHWKMQESPACLEERKERLSPFFIEPHRGHIPPLGQLRVTVTFEAKCCQSLQTVLEMQVENGEPSYLPVYGEVQRPHVYLMSSQLVLRNMYFGIPTEATITLFNGTLLPTKFLWGKLLGTHSGLCLADVHPRSGLLGPNEEKQLSLQFTAFTMDDLTDLALPCQVEGMKKSLVLGISGKAKGLDVTFSIPGANDKSSEDQELGSPQDLCLDFGSNIPLKHLLKRQLILTNNSAIKASFSLEFDYFGVTEEIWDKKPKLPDVPPAMKHSVRIAKHMARRERLDYIETLLSKGKGAAFFPHVSQGTLDAFQKLTIDITACSNMWGDYHDQLICKVEDLPPTIILVHMGVVGCPITLFRTTHLADEPPQDQVIRFGTQISGGDTISRTLRLNNSSPYDIRIDWETYNPKESEDKLVDCLVLYGTPFPLRDAAGVELESKEEPKSDSSLVPSSDQSSVSLGSANPLEAVSISSPSTGPPGGIRGRAWMAIQKAVCQVPRHKVGEKHLPVPQNEGKGMARESGGVRGEASQETEKHQDRMESEEVPFPFMAEGDPKIISLILRPHDGVLSDDPYSITPKQLVIPAAGSNFIHVSFTPMVLPGSVSKMVCNSYALGFMSLDSKIAREIPGKVKRPQNFDAELFRLDLHGLVRPTRLSIEHDYDGGMVFYLQASDLIPANPLTGVLTEMVTTHRLKLNNFTDMAHYFGLLVAPPFSVTGINPEYNRRGWDREEEGEDNEEPAGDQFVLSPQQNMLIEVSFSLSLELLTYQKLPSDQMLPGVKILQDKSGARKMEFSQDLVLEYTNKTTQVVPLLAVVTIPSLQLSTSWVDFGTCFVNETYTREVTLLNLSPCRSHWVALIGESLSMAWELASRGRRHLSRPLWGGRVKVGGTLRRAEASGQPGPPPPSCPSLRPRPLLCFLRPIDKRERDKATFSIYPITGVLEAREVNAPPTSMSLYIHFTASDSGESEAVVTVDGILGEACILHVRGQGSYDEKY
ncbi:deleted in lung and esophageal cancer protein 1 [Petaurus breviceps papuanus]|uniref:deleted in lung and esophageal cancer protein 1 n=1 Tax=Petaurus breviceps papuanus TaxID=3040969 RepID=UPI0036DED651